MKYANARDALPPELFDEVQEHLGGRVIYVPKKEEHRARWGQNSGTRREVEARNLEIFLEYAGGARVRELMEKFCLSESSIRKIISGNAPLPQGVSAI